ncbi:MAG: hypothetical protein P8M64_00595 [Thermodesulfobacteriota bacteirum]|jgi:hypothetical protein|nr:hypothetical protein [bacterium]MDG2445348.1 hypothetical protein [Thermodesulfobacteriota bacterium]|tara:strand:- start:1643 stop:1945 length:303 start_codon:yes stop_codon:yes gene_type:complete
MKIYIYSSACFLILLTAQAFAAEPVFFETVPNYGKLIMMGVAFGIPAFIIFSHIGLFELLDTDSLPKPPSLSFAQREMLSGTIVGTVFGLLITVVCILLS